ncbi:hypothetical protein KBB41_01715 [Candidatus Curtissbacteria bacterium]|nr:hypothetical protein [Candidatus Curtissbacteria bacterium]
MDSNNPISNTPTATPPADPMGPQPQTQAPQPAPVNPIASPAPAPEATPNYTSPASTGQFGSYPPANSIPPDSFGSAASPYTPSTPVGATPVQPMSNAFPSSPSTIPEVATTNVDSSKGKKIWMILIPVIILIIGGGGAAAYFMLSDKPEANKISPDYTITPKEVSEIPTGETSTPVESGFTDTETKLPTTDTTAPPVEQTFPIENPVQEPVTVGADQTVPTQ